MALGALVAGLDAGQGLYRLAADVGRAWPRTRCGRWSRSGGTLLENPATAQFFHRLTAYALLALAAWSAWRFRAQHWSLFPVFAGLVSAQAVLGVITLVHAAPLDLSLTHQALGVIVLMAATRLVWTARA